MIKHLAMFVIALLLAAPGAQAQSRQTVEGAPDAAGVARHARDPSFRDFPNIDCTGATDSSAAVTAILGELAKAQVRHVRLDGCIVSIADKIRFSRVTVNGDNSSYGYLMGENQKTADNSFIVGPSASLYLGDNAWLKGVRVASAKISGSVTTLRGALNERAAFAGTGVVIDGQDSGLDHVTVNGFGLGVYLHGDRATLSYVAGDDTTGIVQDFCGDACRASHLEFWAFLASPYALGSHQVQVSNVARATNKNGAVQITLQGRPETPIQTDDVVTVGNVQGVPGANARWTATRVDDDTFILNGSKFSGRYTGGGAVVLDATMRFGTGIEVGGANPPGGSLWIDEYSEFGHDIGLHVGGKAYGTKCNACWFDGQLGGLYYDNATIGVLVDGHAVDTMVKDSTIIQKSVALRNNAGAGSILSVTNSVIGATGVGAGVIGAGLQALGGITFIGAGSFFRDTGNSADNPHIFVGNGVQNVTLSGLIPVIGDGRVQYQSPRDCSKLLIEGTRAC